MKRHRLATTSGRSVFVLDELFQGEVPQMGHARVEGGQASHPFFALGPALPVFRTGQFSFDPRVADHDLQVIGNGSGAVGQIPAIQQQ